MSSNSHTLLEPTNIPHETYSLASKKMNCATLYKYNTRVPWQFHNFHICFMFTEGILSNVIYFSTIVGQVSRGDMKLSHIYVLFIHPTQNMSINMHLKYDFFDLIDILNSLVQVIRDGLVTHLQGSIIYLLILIMLDVWEMCSYVTIPSLHIIWCD